MGERLTKIELMRLDRRISELNKIIDLCGPNDDDVLDNCEIELTEIVERIERSMRLAQIAESGLRLVI